MSLCSINRDLQCYTGRQRCNSSKTKAQSFYRRPPKHSKTALFFFLFDGRALTATLRHIASTARTAMPCTCAPRSYIAIADRYRRPGPRPTRPPPMHLQFSSNFMIKISVGVSQKNARQTHSLSIHLWENKPRWEKAKRKKRRASWFLAGGWFATVELCCVRHCQWRSSLLQSKNGRLSNPNTCYRVVRVLRRSG